MSTTASDVTAKKLTTTALAAVIFFTVSGGPFGLEPILSYCGGKTSLLLLLAIPVFWDIPIILTVLELNSLMPLTGGYYQWVKKALGLRWACYEGWWSWICAFIDLAIYPQLLIMYASLFFPQIAAFKVPICLAFIWLCAGLNILGIVQVGRTSIVLGIFVLLPFIILFILGFGQNAQPVIPPVHALAGNPSLTGMAIFTIIWNYIGWDNVTTYAGEVRDPAKSYFKAIIIAFTSVFILYLGVTYLAVNSCVSPADLRDNGFPVLGMQIAGKWLSAIIASAGIVSSVGLFLAILLSISRVPEVMAEDKLLPAKLSSLHPRFGTPYVSIIICACVVSIMVLLTFGELLVMDVTIYFAGIVLELIALIRLRKSLQDAPRPFRIPIGSRGLIILAACPIAIYLLAITDILKKVECAAILFIIALLLICSGELIWQLMKWEQRRLSK